MSTPQEFNCKGTYDENWPLPEHLTFEQYSHVFFRPDAHFVEGRVIARSLGDMVHSDTIAALITELHPSARALGAHLCPSLRLRTAIDRIRVCDLVMLAPDAPREQVPTVPPTLCIEVLSPEQVQSDEMETLSDYLAMGVPNIWLIDPVRRSALTFNANGLRESNLLSLTVSGKPINVDLTQLFAASE